MDKKSDRKGLGRGLSALMADVNFEQDGLLTKDNRPASTELMVPIENIFANPDQPRRDFDADLLAELASSIKAKGIIQPLIVRPIKDGNTYQIVAGERRWRAAQMAQLHKIPVVVRSFTDSEVLEVAIIENIQRADLNAVEEALGYKQLMETFGHTQEKLGDALSKSRSHIANTLRLLHLPDGVLMMVRTGTLSAGHARAIIGAPDPLNLAKKIVGAGLSVRQTEKLVRAAGVPRPRGLSGKRPVEKDADTRAIEADLSANLGMSVSIDHEPLSDTGYLRVRYNDMAQLDRLCQILSQLN
jgi:ParB family chromosome partitioning protein